MRRSDQTFHSPLFSFSPSTSHQFHVRGKPDKILIPIINPNPNKINPSAGSRYQPCPQPQPILRSSPTRTPWGTQNKTQQLYLLACCLSSVWPVHRQRLAGRKGEKGNQGRELLSLVFRGSCSSSCRSCWCCCRLIRPARRDVDA